MNSKTNANATNEDDKPAQVPKLRFPEFRDGEEWKAKSIGSMLVETPRQIELNDDTEYRLVTVRRRYGGLVSRGVLKGKEIKVNSQFLVKAGDFLISKRQIVHNACGLVSQELDGSVVSNEYSVLTPRAGCSVEFFEWFAKQPCVSASFLQCSVGIVIEKMLFKLSAWQKRQFLFPPLKEQQKIAECLSSVEELIAAQARKLDELRTHKKGLMQQLFPREGETQPHLRFPGFQNAGEWEEVPLSELVSALDAGVSVNSGDRPATGNEIGVLKTSAVTNGIFEPQENKVVFDEVEIGRVKEPVQGDTIIISRMNTPALVGANAYVKNGLENIFLPDRLWAAKSKSGTSMPFVSLILGSDKGRAALSKLAKGSSGTMKNITKPDVLAFLVMAPLPAEQQRIADCLTSLDDLIAAQTQMLDAIKTHKKGLMQQLFPSPEEVEA